MGSLRNHIRQSLVIKTAKLNRQIAEACSQCPSHLWTAQAEKVVEQSEWVQALTWPWTLYAQGAPRNYPTFNVFFGNEVITGKETLYG